MNVESNYTIAVTTRLLSNLAPVLHPLRGKTKTSRTFSRASRKLQVVSRSSDWFIAPFAVIGRSYYFGIGFSTAI